MSGYHLVSQNVTYAEEGPHVSDVTSTSLPPLQQTENVQGKSLTCDDTVSPVPDYKEDVGIIIYRSILYMLSTIHFIRVLPSSFPHRFWCMSGSDPHSTESQRGGSEMEGVSRGSGCRERE